VTVRRERQSTGARLSFNIRAISIRLPCRQSFFANRGGRFRLVSLNATNLCP